MMLDKLDHVAYVARNLETGVQATAETFTLEVVREFELPEFNLRGVFLANGAVTIEIFQLLKPGLAESRLAGLDLRLDHAGYEVQDLDTATAALRKLGLRFSGPDGVEVDAPIDLGGSLHLWTMPGHGPFGFGLQLIKRP